MAAGEQESTATLLDESSREPAEEEKFARIRVADLRVAEENAPVANVGGRGGGGGRRRCRVCHLLFCRIMCYFYGLRGKVKSEGESEQTTITKGGEPNQKKGGKNTRISVKCKLSKN